MSEKYFQFRKYQIHMSRNFFLTTQLDLLTPEFYFELCIINDIYKTSKGMEKFQIASEINKLLNHGNLHKEKNWNNQNLNTNPYAES